MIATTLCASCQQPLEVPLEILIDGIMIDRQEGNQTTEYLCGDCEPEFTNEI